MIDFKTSPHLTFSCAEFPSGGRRYLSFALMGYALAWAGSNLYADTNAPSTGVEPITTKTVPARLEEALAKKNATDQLQDLSNLAQTLSLTDIPQALQLAEGLKPLRERMVLEYAVLRRWSELAPAEAFALIAKKPEGREKVQALRLAADRWAQKNTAAAVAAVTALPPGKSAQGATDAVAAAWAKIDGREALAWANGLPDGRKETALYALRFAWVHADPVAAAANVAQLPPGNTKNALVANVAEEWTRIDSTAALQWIQGLPEGPEKQIALTNAARTRADVDPAGAAQFALSLGPPELRQNAVMAVITNWASQQPKAAGDWAVAQADPEIQKNAIRTAVGFWAVVAPADTEKWIESIPSPSARTIAIQCYAQAASAWAPDLAVKLITRTAPELASQPSAMECVQQWMAIDPVAAQKWIADAKLQDDLKKRWLSSAVKPQ